MPKPIWCKCRKHIFRRKALQDAVSANKTLICANPECQRRLLPEEVEEACLKLGLIDYSPPNDATAGYEQADDEA